MRIWTLLVTACCILSVAACTSMEANRATMRERYVGKPLNVAVAGMGYPEAEVKMSGRQLYTWVKSDAWGNPCKVRLEVDAQDIVVGESMEARIPEACERFVK